mmetsp:Transcript_19870/g.27958  ORF Transcript_19870/g.27958 Transcript_19870/m.27958 type:complete len:85 (+) Transcript_19870:1874-2128(+)
MSKGSMVLLPIWNRSNSSTTSYSSNTTAHQFEQLQNLLLEESVQELNDRLQSDPRINIYLFNTPHATPTIIHHHHHNHFSPLLL